MCTVPPPDSTKQSLREFAASLPLSYQERYAPAQMAAHAHVSASRGERPVHVASFPWHDPSLSALCVVAEDRPGLLALISEAFVTCGLDVQAAEAYTRSLHAAEGASEQPLGTATKRAGRGSARGEAPHSRRLSPSEAVDLFWVRRIQGDPITETEVENLRAVLVDLLSGRREPADELDPLVGGDFSSETTVRFIEGTDGRLDVLEVETDDRSGLLLVLSRALFELQVQITSSQVRTSEKRVFDRFTLEELDGSPIDDSRRLEIQVAVLSAVEPMTQIREIRRSQGSNGA